jgi:hypothetical protein
MSKRDMRLSRLGRQGPCLISVLAALFNALDENVTLIIISLTSSDRSKCNLAFFEGAITDLRTNSAYMCVALAALREIE